MHTVRHPAAQRFGIALLFITLAWPGSDLPAQADAPIDLDIPAGRLATALNRLVDESGLQIVYDARLTEGLQSRRVSGRYTPEGALRELLADTDLDYRVREAGTVILERAAQASPPPEPLAQATPPPEPEEEVVTLPAITVTGSPLDETGYNVLDATTATKTDTPIFETPFSIQVVPHDVIQDQRAVRLDDVVKNVSGVQRGFDSGAVFDNFIVRGFRLDSEGLVYRDGFRQRNPQTDLANVERVEILKGASAGLYGRIEPGGLVDVVTKKPLPDARYSIEQQIGQYDFYRTVIDATGPLNTDNSLLYRTVFAYQDNDSFRDEVENRHILVSPSLSWDITPQTQFYLNFEYKNFDDVLDVGIPVLGNRPVSVPSERWFGLINAPLSETESYIVDSHLVHRFNQDWSMKLRGAWWRFDARYSETGPAFGSGVRQDAQGRFVTGIGSSFPYDQNDETYFGEVSLNGGFQSFGMEHQILFAGEYFNYDSFQHHTAGFGNPRDQFGNPVLLTPIDIFNPVYQQFSDIPRLLQHAFFSPADEWYAFTAQDSVAVTDKLRLLASGRYDHTRQSRFFCSILSNAACPNVPARERETDSFTPRVGVNYQLLPWLAGFGSYSESFANSQFGILENGQLSEPETATQYEIGLKSEWLDGRFNGSLVYYYLTKENLITPIRGMPGVVNQIGEARSQGVELDVTGQLSENWRLIGAFAYTDAEITKDQDDSGGLRNTGHRLPNVPAYSGSLWNWYEFPNGFGLGAGVYAASQREGDDANSFQLPGYVQLDAAASYKLKLGRSRITTQLNVHNLLDKTYFEASRLDRGSVQIGAPLTVIGSVRLEF